MAQETDAVTDNTPTPSLFDGIPEQLDRLGNEWLPRMRAFTAACAEGPERPDMSDYKPITITRTDLIVENPVPEKVLISLALLADLGNGAHMVNADTLYIGRDRSGNRVCYRIVGWDAERRGLIAELDLGLTPRPEPAQPRIEAPGSTVR
jgi:hypothetical protein